MAILSIPAWAANANVEAAGIPNFHQVNEHVYRGAQPTDDGWHSLAQLGVKTVIDLRRKGEHSTPSEQKAVEAAGMHYINVPMNGVMAPSDADVSKVLAILNSSEPVFVHCKEGKDRTGTVIAVYRMLHDHWENDKALQEAESYGMHWVEFGMKRYIATYRVSTQNAAPTQSAAAAPALQTAAAQSN